MARVFVAEVVLHDAKIRALVGKGVAAGVAQHVWVDVADAGAAAQLEEQIIDGLLCRCAWPDSV